MRVAVLSSFLLLIGCFAEAQVVNYRVDANGVNATGSNFGSNEFTDGSRLFASWYEEGNVGGFGDFYISATPLSLQTSISFVRADAVIAAIGDTTQYSNLDDVRFFVWDANIWLNGEPLADNAITISDPLDYGQVGPNDKPPLFGGLSSGNAPNPDFAFLQYRLLSGTFNPVTLAAGEYYVALLGTNPLSFELAQSSIEKTGNIMPGDRFFSFPRWFNFLFTQLYEDDGPEFQGTLALDLYYPVSLGDVNQDGFVNLLDIEPFVNLLTLGQFQAEADINQDGLVNLLDIEGFVDLLSAG